MAIYYEPLSLVLATLLLLLLLSSISLISFTEATKNGGVTLDLIHRESSLSPSYDPSITHFERLRNLFRRSISRHSALRSASFKSASKSSDSFEGTLTSIGGEYLIKISIGTPPVEILAIVDTGSDLTLTQCVPCTQCYKQKAPLCDPTKTTTYRSVSCTSQQCQSLGNESSSCHKSNGCLYQVSYGDSSYSNGNLAVETFTFNSSTSKESVVFPKVVFGCGHNNDGTFNETGSGIVGLGGGAVSIKSPDTFYYLTLEGVSVGNEAVAYNYIPNSNSKASVEEGNIIIDSGTTLTYLPSSLYEGLESTLEKSISGNRVSDPQELFGLCYKLPSNGEFNAPPIIAHFTGADVELTQENTFLEVEKGVVCLTFVPSEDLAIFVGLKSPDLFEATLTPIGGEYLIKINIGTPPVEILAIADTGSDLTWTQCVPCPQCYKQNAPLFDPSKTATYRSVSCTSQQCQSLGAESSSCDKSNSCLYQVRYGDSSYSKGDLAVETFAFDSSTSNESVVFPKVVFGCGHNNDGTFNETGSGIVGLGGGTVSIVRQLETTIGGKFSYCLTTLDSNSSSKISFGPNAIVIGPKVSSTPIVQKSPDTFYYLTLEGVSVGNEALAYNYIPNFNSKASFKKGNIIIDSGTTLTFLPSSLYEELESTLEKSISGNRVSDPQRLFGLCYELPRNGEFNVPPIIAHFTGANVELTQENTFLEVEKGWYV
ncbi:Aspartic proteinase CDR1 [Sesamum angolense]|uniref:Aspartic proteinase CDR1 n=1 Tax=Sesamum angolense TaxID=2727404 RepID=A0AAE2BKU4_9LAMI|nr:Aspartic proteinase CDR1 [Sesamum angolense]